MSGIQMALMGSGVSSNTIQIIAGAAVSGTTTWDGYGATTYTGAPSDIGTVIGTDKVTIFGGATLLACYQQYDTTFGIRYVELVISGNQTSTTWASMTIDGTTFTKAALGGSGSYASGGNYTAWSVYVSSDPFTAFPSNIVFA